MDENTNPQTPPQMPPTQNRAPIAPSESSAAGPVIGAIIIVAVLILGGFYYWGAYLEERDRAALTAEDIMNQPDVILEQLKTQGTSDELGAIEADVDATDLENLTTELDQI